MAKKPAQSTAKRPAAKKGPPKKMTDTLIEFGSPIIAQLDKTSPPGVVHDLFQIIVIVWNAHVRAMPAWGRPESLRTLQDLANDEGQPELLRYAFGALTLRRFEKFRTDERAVGKWSVSLNPDGKLEFSCEAVLPPGPNEPEA
ncbi:MAG: hypothetical protein MUF34_02235 [Polyangiaceae bacterium]|jgi:hypothetical protein|nr:hypothetical protein [Polyangiaceae bacterium]